MEELQIFSNNEFGEVRTLDVDGRPYFAGTDVARALGYSEPHKAVTRHCRDDGMIRTPITDRLGRMQETVFIPEGDLYRLIISSKLPSAEKFERWVFDEVLPAIRKHGAYMTESTLEKALCSPDFLIKLATELKDEKTKRAKLEQENKAMQPKAIFADAVSASDTSILVGELAKVLRQNGIEIGQNRLFAWLREKGYLMKGGASKNMPTQSAMECGLFEIKEGSYINSSGTNITTKTTKVTGKGQIYFVNKFLTRD